MKAQAVWQHWVVVVLMLGIVVFTPLSWWTCLATFMAGVFTERAVRTWLVMRRASRRLAEAAERMRK